MTGDYKERLAEIAGPDGSELIASLGLPADVPIESLVDDYPWFGALLDAGRDLPLHVVPRSLGVRLRAMIHTHDSVMELRPDPLAPAQVAQLQSDSRQRRELVGVRGGSVDNWTMMFRSPLADVAIGVSSIDERSVRLSGQVLVHEGDSRRFNAELAGGPERGSVPMTDSGDAFGRFGFDRVPAEVVQLVLSDGVTRIVAELDLSSGRDAVAGD